MVDEWGVPYWNIAIPAGFSVQSQIPKHHEPTIVYQLLYIYISVCVCVTNVDRIHVNHGLDHHTIHTNQRL